VGLALDVIVATAALIGAALGIFNYVEARKLAKVRLNIEPKAMFPMGFSGENSEQYLSQSKEFLRENQPPETIGFTITNLSSFPVVLDEIGFLHHGSNRRAVIPCPITDDDVKWPNKLNPRESVTVRTRLVHMLETSNLHQLRCCYVKTACGSTAKAQGPVLKGLVEYVRDSV